MKFVTRKRTGSSVINLTPLIDCMFLLVIFIMIAARFEPDGGIPVELPTARTGEGQQLESITLTITIDGDMFLQGEPVEPEDLETAIVEARTAAGDTDGSQVVLVVYGDKDAQHGRVVEALDAAARVKHRRVIIRTRQ